jgi:predicted ATPase
MTPVQRCECQNVHQPRRIVLTGGPGAGKTATLEMIKESFCEHVRILPEAASVVFGGGFPRPQSVEGLKAAQRAIFSVQRELEALATAENAAIVLCDRGTVDGLAYWPGPEELWPSIGTNREEQFARYQTVIHLRTPSQDDGYNHANRLRTESATEAKALDDRILRAWDGHPHRIVVESSPDFLAKAARVIELIRTELPPCCLAHDLKARLLPVHDATTPN